MPKREDLTGQIFGKLIVLEYSHTDKNRTSRFLCRCECGIEKIISKTALKRNHKPTKSCGCLHFEQLKNKRSDKPELMAAKRLWKSNYKDGCSFETFLRLSQLPCHYCGKIKSNKYNPYTTPLKTGRITKEWFDQCWFEYNGLDRIDSSKSHSEDNIVPCCVHCNIAKSNMTTEEFISWIRLIYEYFILNKTNGENK
jgi:hypothetical protein